MEADEEDRQTNFIP